MSKALYNGHSLICPYSVMEADTSQDELLCNEGTVILHMDFALKQNQVFLTVVMTTCILRGQFRNCLRNFSSH